MRAEVSAIYLWTSPLSQWDHMVFGCWSLALCPFKGGICWGSAGTALHEWSGSSTKGRTPNIRYFVAKLIIVAIYTPFESLSYAFQRKPSCLHRAFNESHLAFVELSTKTIIFCKAFNESHYLRNCENLKIRALRKLWGIILRSTKPANLCHPGPLQQLPSAYSTK